MADNLVPNAILSLLLLRSIVCASALCGDRILHRVKSMQDITHPVALFGSLAAWGERSLNKKNQQHSNLFVSILSSNLWRGLLWSVSLLMIALLFGMMLERVVASLAFGARDAVGGVAGFGCWLLIHSFLCAWMIAHAQLDGYVAKIESELKAGKISAARKTLSHIVGRETSALSSQAIARAAMESLAENSSDGTIAPLIYYLLFGLPGLFLYKAVNTLDSQFGYRGARYGEFGSVSARIDDCANLLPARITAYGICLVALFKPSLSGLSALQAMWRFAPSIMAWARSGFRSSPNAPHPEAALAGALGVKLAGKRLYKMHGEIWQVGDWIGFGTENCNSSHINCARLLVNYTMLFLVIILIFMLTSIVWRFDLWSYPFLNYFYYS